MLRNQSIVAPALLALAVLAGPVAGPADAAESATLLQVRTEGSSIAGQPLLVELRIFRDGTMLSISRNGTQAGGAQDETGVILAPPIPGSLGELQRTLNAVRIATLEGNCGGPMPDFYTDHVVTWNGRGFRRHTLTFGANLTGCSAEVKTLAQAVQRFYDRAAAQPVAVVYSPTGVLSPFAN